MPTETYVRCPKCSWEPLAESRWRCDECETLWDTFETRGHCPACGKVYIDTQCFKREGCGEWSPNADWYVDLEVPEQKKQASPLFMFWKNDDPPVTLSDQLWIDRSLRLISSWVGDDYFESVKTITPDDGRFDLQFTGTEADADFLFHQIASILHIETGDVSIRYYHNGPVQFRNGILATPASGYKEMWGDSQELFVDNGPGQREIWIEISQLQDPEALMASLTNGLTQYKLLSEGKITNKGRLLMDLAPIALGFGIFKGNSYFRFSKWQGVRSSSWQTQRTGYLPEPVIAYAMAWLAHYRGDDVSWKPYLNKTMKKYFEQSYQYIRENYIPVDL